MEYLLRESRIESGFDVNVEGLNPYCYGIPSQSWKI